MWLCACVCVCVCVFVANHTSETSEAITIKLDTVTASLHHVLIILTLTFI